MDLIIGMIIGLIISLVVITIKNYFSNRPPCKLMKLASLNTNDMELVSRSESEKQIIEEYTDGKHTIKRYILRHSNKAIKKENKTSQ